VGIVDQNAEGHQEDADPCQEGIVRRVREMDIAFFRLRLRHGYADPGLLRELVDLHNRVRNAIRAAGSLQRPVVLVVPELVAMSDERNDAEVVDRWRRGDRPFQGRRVPGVGADILFALRGAQDIDEEDEQ
jgi:hypothetical protein